jgi:putative ABC transport system permease protein
VDCHRPGPDRFAYHRIDRLAIPWDLIVLGMLLAVLTATAAAWWLGQAPPGYRSRSPCRPWPHGLRPAHRPALLAALMIVAGVACLGLANQARTPLIIAGWFWRWPGDPVHQPAGHPGACRAGQARRSRCGCAARLARHQARSGARPGRDQPRLGITAAIIISSAADKSAANAQPARHQIRSGSASQTAETARLARSSPPGARPAWRPGRPRCTRSPDRRTTPP